jgi:hypothetical protein
MTAIIIEYGQMGFYMNGKLPETPAKRIAVEMGSKR